MDLHERIAELESKLESSVAHNLALRKFITDSCYVFEGEQSDYSDAYVTADEYMPLNPAAGAEIINAPRAEEIDSFAKQMRDFSIIPTDSAQSFLLASKYAEQYAAQLRNGDHVAKDGE